MFFRSVAPHKSRRSPTAITPYMSALDGMMATPQVSSVLDENTPYASWLARRQVESPGQARPE